MTTAPIGAGGAERPTERVTEPQRPEASLGDLFAEMGSELGSLFRQEIELAKTEARDEVRAASRAAALFGGAGIAGWMTLLFVSFAVAWWLDEAMDTGLSFAIVGVVWLIAALVMAASARARMKAVRALPETRRSMKEDMEWARAQKS